MDDQNKNLILATVLSLAVILVWTVFFPAPEIAAPAETSIVSADSTVATPDAVTALTPTAQTDAANVVATGAAAPTALLEAKRTAIETPRLSGTISLLGGRIDELKLSDYKVTQDEGADTVTLFSPVGSDSPYYALFGWAASTGVTPETVPNANTNWELVDGDILEPGKSITLAWDNGAGLLFNRIYDVDADYMFTITQNVTNNGATAASMAPYGVLARHGEPKDLKNFFVLHEGLVTMADELTETNWDDMPDFDIHPKEGVPAERIEDVKNGWIGMTDHFWMTTLIPAQDVSSRLTAKYNPSLDIYQTETVMNKVTVEPGATATNTIRLFAGAKEWETIREYQTDGVTKFIDSIDWGWFFFLTKPIFWLLHEINKLIGNMGWSIIGLTLIIKAVLFPLAYKSYVSMAKMKELQPEMEKLKAAAGDDRQKMQQGMMELYKKNKVNPAAGCMPILLQIPIFFSLYKVIFVTIELRHAPWFGPFRDLSAPDPTTLLNLFGLFPNGAPEAGSVMALIFIGILPIILGISMWLQQKLNPAPTDPTQQMIFAWMPWVFMFMLGSFASGLVVYWIANNTITFTQQYLIMRSQGYKPDVFGNIKSSLKRKPKED
ncbi:MAG: membrane protein insertase YidC [Rhodobacteraceae bacterium]|nr:membrane protein insertase YidC [Paracoccaceae bacterium]